MLDKSQLPFTTDLVFGTEGYDITYKLEDTNFVPSSLTPRDQDPMDHDGNDGYKDKPVEHDPENVLKKFKNAQGSSGSKSITGSENNGPAPMQAQLVISPSGIQRLRSLMQPLQWEDLAKLPPVAMTPMAASTLTSPKGTPGSKRISNNFKKILPSSASDLTRSTSGTRAVVGVPLSATSPISDKKWNAPWPAQQKRYILLLHIQRIAYKATQSGEEKPWRSLHRCRTKLGLSTILSYP